MSTESREVWRQWLADKTPIKQAEHIIAKMIGYRSLSIYRETDVQNLATAIEVIAANDKSSRSLSLSFDEVDNR